MVARSCLSCRNLNLDCLECKRTLIPYHPPACSPNSNTKRIALRWSRNSKNIAISKVVDIELIGYIAWESRYHMKGYIYDDYRVCWSNRCENMAGNGIGMTRILLQLKKAERYSDRPMLMQIRPGRYHWLWRGLKPRC